MRFDISAIAKKYGLVGSKVPSVMVETSDDDMTGSPAWFDANDWTLHINPETDLTDSYNQQRFETATGHGLSQEDGLRFVIAHELWHAVQDSTPEGQDAMIRLNFLMYLGLVDHDERPDEQDADNHAATAYQLVGISAWSDNRDRMIVSTETTSETTTKRGWFGRVRSSVFHQITRFGLTVMAPYDRESAEALYRDLHGIAEQDNGAEDVSEDATDGLPSYVQVRTVGEDVNGPATGAQC